MQKPRKEVNDGITIPTGEKGSAKYTRQPVAWSGRRGDWKTGSYQFKRTCVSHILKHSISFDVSYQPILSLFSRYSSHLAPRNFKLWQLP